MDSDCRPSPVAADPQQPPPAPAGTLHIDAVDSAAVNPAAESPAVTVTVTHQIFPALLPPAVTGTVLTDELREKIVRQVEYYFSDTNLPTDKFLMKYVSRDKHGFVPIAVISSFKKMKKLVQDLSLIVAALRTSSQLVVNTAGTKVRRSNPLPETDHKDDQRLSFQPCTVIVENLPENHSQDCIQKLFGNVGNISKIIIHDPHSAEESATARKGESAISNKLHALVEYESADAAERAVASLNDEKNWSGMRVELLSKRMGRYGRLQRSTKENPSGKGENQNPDAAVDDGQKSKSNEHQNETVHIEEGSGAKGRRQTHYKSRGRGQYSTNGQGHGHVPSSNEVSSKPISGPKMPDGTRGFALGRGKPLFNTKE